MMESNVGNFALFFGFMTMILLGGAVIWLIVWFVEKKIIPGKKPPERPLETAKRRYAAGELTKKEYLDMKKEIVKAD